MHFVRHRTEFQNFQIAAWLAGTLLIASCGMPPHRAGPLQEVSDTSQDISQRVGLSDPSLNRDALQMGREREAVTGAATQGPCLLQDATAPSTNGYNLSEFPEDPAQSLPPEIGAVVDEAADVGRLDRTLMRTIAYVESSGNPKNVTGSYKGLFQLSASEFAKYGNGNIFDPRDNARAAAFKLTDEMLAFLGLYGRFPSPTEIYLTHQQGVGGLANHLTNPTGLAWQNMAATAEGRQKGEAWARAAIWGNVPSDLKWKYVSVDNLTSAEFIELWRRRVEAEANRETPAAAKPEGDALLPQQEKCAEAAQATSVAYQRGAP